MTCPGQGMFSVRQFHHYPNSISRYTHLQRASANIFCQGRLLTTKSGWTRSSWPVRHLKISSPCMASFISLERFDPTSSLLDKYLITAFSVQNCCCRPTNQRCRCIRARHRVHRYCQRAWQVGRLQRDRRRWYGYHAR